MFKNKQSFLERFTGLLNQDADEENEEQSEAETEEVEDAKGGWEEEAEGDGELTVDMYQTSSEIVIQTMIAGVKPDDLDISISRDMVTVKGKRERSRTVAKDDYFFEELYWGGFTRTIILPEEVEVEESEATCQNGLLTIRLPKVDKQKTQKLKIKL